MKPVLLGLVLAMMAGAAAAQTVRTSLKPDSEVVLGQPVRLFVDVLFPEVMPRPPRVNLPDMPGAQIVRYETQATTMSDRIDGKEYVGQRFEFALYPRRGGTLQVPAPRVTVLDAKGDTTGHRSGQPLEIEVAVPPGVDASRPVVATRKLTLEETWSRQPSTPFKAGDALVRTVTRAAADVPGMAMLALSFPAPPGIRVYLDPPQTDDRVERGDVTGRRVDRATYVFERAGSFPLPSVVQPWWDLEAKRLRQAEGPGATIAVSAVALPQAIRGARLERWIYVTTTLLGGLMLAWWMAPRLVRALTGLRMRWRASEHKAFSDLVATCRGADAAATYRAFVIWRRRAPTAAVSPLAEEIESAVFAGVPWSTQSARAFAARVRAARGSTHIRAAPHPALAPLNPLPLRTDTR